MSNTMNSLFIILSEAINLIHVVTRGSVVNLIPMHRATVKHLICTENKIHLAIDNWGNKSQLGNMRVCTARKEK